MVQLARYCKNDMKIGYGQDLFHTCFDPFFPLLDLALGTVPVSATVVGYPLMGTVGATLEVSPQYGRSTIDNGPDHFSFLVAYLVAFQKIVTILPEYTGHFVLRSQEMWYNTSSGLRRSSYRGFATLR